MGFFEKLNKTSTPFDGKCTSVLLRALKKKKMISKTSRPRKWSDEFSKMRRVDKMSKQRIKRVLKWYANHIGDEYVPMCLSASSFRKKFINIERAMSRGVISKRQEITDLILQLQEDSLPGFIWPKDEKKDELLFLQQSYDNYLEFNNGVKKLWLWAEENDPAEQKIAPNKTRRRCGSMEWIAGAFWEILSTPKQHTVDWAFEVHKIAFEWDNWNGNLLKWVWHPQRKKCRRHLTDAMMSGVTSDPDVAEQYLDRVLEGIKNFA